MMYGQRIAGLPHATCVWDESCVIGDFPRGGDLVKLLPWICVPWTHIVLGKIYGMPSSNICVTLAGGA